MGYVLIGVLALLAIQEVVRYRRCQENPEEIPFPRRSLSRRLAITLDFIILLLLAMFWPHTSPWLQMILMGFVGVAALVGFFLLWRDLRETSINAVAQASRLNKDASCEFAEAIKIRSDKKKAQLPEGKDSR